MHLKKNFFFNDPISLKKKPDTDLSRDKIIKILFYFISSSKSYPSKFAKWTKELVPPIHTYINNWSLQPFRYDYDLASYSTYVVCVNFIHKYRGNCSLNLTLNDRFLRNFSWHFCSFSQFLQEIC